MEQKEQHVQRWEGERTWSLEGNGGSLVVRSPESEAGSGQMRRASREAVYAAHTENSTSVCEVDSSICPPDILSL